MSNNELQKNFCGFNDKKLKFSDLKGIQKEANRESEEYKNYVNPDQSKENVYFKKSDDWRKEVEDVCTEYNLKLNRNAVPVISTVVYASADWIKKMQQERPEAIREYFEDSYKWMSQRGKVINAVVHYDETTPHLHVAWVPLAHDIANRSKGQVTGDVHTGISAKHCLGNRVQMSIRQTEFHKAVGEKYGLERGLVRIDSNENVKHLTEIEYKRKREQEKFKDLQKENAHLQIEIESKRITRKSVTEELKQLQTSFESLSDDVSHRRFELEELNKRLEIAKKHKKQLEEDGKVKEDRLQRLEDRLTEVRDKIVEERSKLSKIEVRSKELIEIDKPGIINAKSKIEAQYLRIAQLEQETIERVTKETQEKVREEMKEQLRNEQKRELEDEKRKLKKEFTENLNTIEKRLEMSINDRMTVHGVKNDVLKSLLQNNVEFKNAYEAEQRKTLKRNVNYIREQATKENELSL